MRRLSRALIGIGEVALISMAVRSCVNACRADALEAEVQRLNGVVDEAVRVKEDFLATLSHELRTPLNAMLGWLQLLRMHIEEPAERAHALEVLERNAHAQLHIVADLLDASRIVTGKMQLVFEQIDLPEIVSHACETLGPTARAKDVSLRAEFDDIHGTVYGDRARLQQVIWNLVNNAVKFTPPGGDVILRIHARGRTLELEVADTGIGIEPDMLPHVFERFRQGDTGLTRAYGGLGLGLSIVRHLVELHGGSVTARSAGRDRGATFSVRLPFRPAPPESAWDAAASQAFGRQA
jgi:signal transduction histidine kinase